MTHPTRRNLSELAKHFSDKSAAWELLERIRWPEGPICPHCGTIGKAYYLAPQTGTRTTRTGKVSYRRIWQCAECRKQFSVLVGTIFEDSRIPLPKWLLAIHMMCANKNGVAAFELHRVLGITHKSAWFMAHRIRYAMARPPLVDKLSGIVEADETYIGGKASGKRGRGALNKTPVVTLVERDGEARSQVMHTVTGANVGAGLREHVDPKTTLYTNSYQIYSKPGKEFAAHETVNHGEGEYSRGTVHTNTAVGYFSH